MLANILAGVQSVFMPLNLLFMFLGLFVGIIFGALPGFSATMGVAVCLPITYGMNPATALILLSGVYCGGVYGGSIPAILLGIPGTPASAPTAFEGRPLTKRGEAGKALGICTTASSIGGFASAVALLMASPLLAAVALRVGPPETMMIAIFGLSVVCMLSPDKFFKGLLVAAFALLLATIGQDPLYGYARFTFGKLNLLSGVSVVPILIGIFALPEVFEMLETPDGKLVECATVGRLLPKFSDFAHNIGNLIRSCLIGIGIGIIPAAGPDIAAFLSYNQAKKSSKHPEEYGTGSVEGIIASETANNAVTGGSLIPLLSLGIPGSAPAALFLSALYLHGMQPGAGLFTTNAATTYTMMVGFAVINILLFFTGILFCKFAGRIVIIPKSILSTAIVVLAVVGSYSITKNMFDVYQMFIAGFVGYLLQKNDFPVSPVALALLLGSLLEKSISQTTVMYPDNFLAIFTRPITIVFTLFIVIAFGWPVFQKIRKGSKEKNTSERI
ncbi:MAG: tripartite tricarboxylate transporter permease [Lachnospiraceae bacterium]|nr:tripartite tricarboxylate transporter permease [Lachnospiraceae bacterium]